MGGDIVRRGIWREADGGRDVVRTERIWLVARGGHEGCVERVMLVESGCGRHVVMQRWKMSRAAGVDLDPANGGAPKSIISRR